jgi:hypothetical protein
VVASAGSAKVWTMDADRVVRLAVYWDGTKGLEAVGLSD